MCTGWLIARTADVATGDEWLLPDERDVLARLVVPKRREEWRLGRWTGKRAVAQALALPAAHSVEIRAAEDGAPEAWRDGAPLPVGISLSHRAGAAVCAVSMPASPVGCDVELVEPRAAAFGAEWFGESERRMVGAATPAERDVVVTMLWSAKESVLKMLRCGLRRDPRSLVVLRGIGPPVDGWQPLHVRDVAGGLPAAAWWRVEGDLVVTVAAPPHVATSEAPPARLA